jgi:hypothetical protein
VFEDVAGGRPYRSFGEEVDLNVGAVKVKRERFRIRHAVA